jgi:predicted ATPase
LSPDSLEIASLLNPLLNLTIPASSFLQSLDEETRLSRLLELITNLLIGRATEMPLAVMIDNLHWADRSSLRLISHLSNNIKTSFLLICLTTRPKEDMVLELSNATTNFVLDELTDTDSLKLVEQMLEIPTIPESLSQIIL